MNAGAQPGAAPDGDRSQGQSDAADSRPPASAPGEPAAAPGEATAAPGEPESPRWSLGAAISPAVELLRALGAWWAAFTGRWYVRLAAWLGFWLVVTNAVINALLLPLVNHYCLPGWTRRAEEVLLREVGWLGG